MNADDQMSADDQGSNWDFHNYLHFHHLPLSSGEAGASDNVTNSNTDATSQLMQTLEYRHHDNQLPNQSDVPGLPTLLAQIHSGNQVPEVQVPEVQNLQCNAQIQHYLDEIFSFLNRTDEV